MSKPTKGVFTLQRKIRWGDGDVAGIAYTANFLDFIMEAVEDWFCEVAGADWYEININHRFGTPFVHFSCDIKGQLKPGDQLFTDVLVEKLGRSSLTLRAIGRRGDGEVSFEAKLVSVVTNASHDASIPIPDDVRARVEAYMAGGGTYVPAAHSPAEG